MVCVGGRKKLSRFCDGQWWSSFVDQEREKKKAKGEARSSETATDSTQR